MTRKVWAYKEQLASADVNSYLMDQTVPRFASTTERDAQWPAPPNGALCVTTDTLTLWWRHATWRPAGTTAWTSLPLTSPWVADGVTPAYRKAGDVVELRGSINGGTGGSTAGTLPVGFRPPFGALNFAAYQWPGSPQFCGVTVTTGGLVQVFPSSGTPQHVALDVVRFSTTT